MSIKATFSTGSNSTTVKGLYQWDYGRVLEIEDFELGTELVEVHFACSGMTEAVVRPCNFVDGVGTVTIPDQCLEQSSNIVAWIYRVNISGTEGYTWKTITLPITARTRPIAIRDVPADVIDRYTELITEVEEAVESLESGSITVASAKNAGSANFANTANIAEYASHDTSKGTIEKRLTELAFKAGNITPAEGSAVLDDTNILLKQGHYVIGIYFGKGTSRDYGSYQFKVGTVPEELRPKAEKRFYGSVKGVDSFLESLVSSAPQYAGVLTGGVSASATFVLTPEGELWVESIDDIQDGSLSVVEVYVSLGYQLNDE